MQRAASDVPTSHAVSTVGRGDASTLFVSPSVGLSVGLSVGRSCCVSVVKATVRRRLAVGHSLVWVVGLAVKTSKDTNLRARKVGWFVPCQRYHPAKPSKAKRSHAAVANVVVVVVVVVRRTR